MTNLDASLFGGVGDVAVVLVPAVLAPVAVLEIGVRRPEVLPVPVVCVVVGVLGRVIWSDFFVTFFYK